MPRLCRTRPHPNIAFRQTAPEITSGRGSGNGSAEVVEKNTLIMRCPDGHEVLADVDLGGMLLRFTMTAALTVGGTITHSKPCPHCGKPLTAPGGTYTPDQNGLMVRVENETKQ
jgi:hypothetical protein